MPESVLICLLCLSTASQLLQICAYTSVMSWKCLHKWPRLIKATAAASNSWTTWQTVSRIELLNIYHFSHFLSLADLIRKDRVFSDSLGDLQFLSQGVWLLPVVLVALLPPLLLLLLPLLSVFSMSMTTIAHHAWSWAMTLQVLLLFDQISL